LIRFPHLSRPGKIGQMELRNRVVMAPLGTNLADVNGAVSERLMEWHAERARGGVGLIIVGNAAADTRFGRGLAHQLRVEDPKFTPGLHELVETVQAEGAKIALQINIQGGGVDLDLQPGAQAVGPSGTAYVFDKKGSGSGLPARMRRVKEVRALSVGEIQELGKAFVRASLIAKAAGFDAVELHGAHGYLLAAFLSPFSNTRDDAYGGDFERRFRFVQEVYEGVRNAVGGAYPILIRLSGREYLEGGREMEETRRLVKRLEEIGVDAIDVSAGITMDAEAFAWLTPPASFPQGAFLRDAAEIKREVGIPVIGVGKIRDPWFAEKMLAEGQVDFVALGRTLIADPAWPNKAFAGATREIRRCISCNRCWSILYRHPICCAINARAGRERAFPMTPAFHRRRVAVVGGGPAGMEAARVAAERGHAVTLFEKERHLGGQLRLAVVPPFKRDLAGLLGYLKTQVQKKVEVKLQHEVHAAELLQGQFDFVILAAGCFPPEPGRQRDPRVVKTWDALSGRAKVDGNKIVVVGQSRVACETAELLCRRKKKNITILHSGPREDFGKDMEPIFERRLLLDRLEASAVKIYHETSFVGFTPEGIAVKGSYNGMIPCDRVIIDDFPISNNALLGELQGRMAVIAIGDCVSPGDIYKAIHSGFRASYQIS
jgi:2,4-dienoyl-CoA reductase-like NADH-dependent reductase (Old Yellow Enzyme family)/thioredoxin reductase